MAKTYKFPKGFLWGAGTAAHQVEGGNVNNWSEWETRNAKRLAKEALSMKKVSWHAADKKQEEKDAEMFESKNYISGRACEHYQRFEEDFDIAKSLNHNAYRFSIEWSRIEPKEGKIDEKEIEHYRQVLLALKKRGIEPFVVLYHWTLPVWFAEKGGWLNPKAPYYFDRFVKIISENLFDLVDFWITLNEPNIYGGCSFLLGIHPPQNKNVFKYFKVLNNLAKAHKLAYRSLHLIDLDCQVGISKNNVYFEGGLLAKLAHYFWNKYFLNKIKEKQDFIGFNYYYRNRVKWLRFGQNENKEVSDMGWEIYPKGIYCVLKDLERYGKPIYITENGLADAKDKKREKFIKEHLFWIHKAIKSGVDVRGYLHWSLFDNFEWNKGLWPKFGLVDVDYKTMKRRVRRSARVYAEICGRNELEM